TSSRFRGAAVVDNESIRRRAVADTSSTARSNATAFTLDGALKPLNFRTNCSDAAQISSSVAGGSKLNSVLMLLHICSRTAKAPPSLAQRPRASARQASSLSRQLSIFYPVRLIRRGTEPPLPVGLVILVVAFEPDHLAIALERQHVRRD